MLQLIQSNLSNYQLFYHKKGFKIITAKDYGKIYHLCRYFHLECFTSSCTRTMYLQRRHTFLCLVICDTQCQGHSSAPALLHNEIKMVTTQDPQARTLPSSLLYHRALIFYLW